MALGSDNSVIYQNNLLSSYFAIFEEMKQTGEHCDVTFKVGNRLLPAHCNITAAAIPYFRTMFRSGVRNEKNGSEIAVEEVDSDTLETFINFAYGRKITINDENVRSLLLGAEFLQIEEMCRVCCDFLEKNMSPNNVFRIRSFGECSCRTSLVEKCNRYIRENFDKCSQCEEFCDLPFTAVKQLISGNDLKVEGEEKVFEALMRWIKKSPSTREDSLPELLKDVRLTLLTPAYLLQQVANEELVRNSAICKDLLEEAKTYLLLPEKQSPLRPLPRFYKNERATPENEDLEGIYVTAPNSYPSVEFYNFEKRMWTNLPFTKISETSDEKYHSVGDFRNISHLIEANNKIFVFRDAYLDELDLKTKTWRFVKYLDEAVQNDVVVTHCNRIYFCGGIPAISAPWRMKLFDPMSYSFTVAARAPLSLEDPGVTSLGEDIYIIGGTVWCDQTRYNTTNAVITYNTETQIWTRLPPMRTKRSSPGSAVLNGKVYVCGGFQGLCGDRVRLFLSDAEMYCPSASKWFSIAPMFSTGKVLSSVFHRGKLHVFQSSNGMLTVDVYDPKTGKFVCYEVMSKPTECSKEAKAVAVSEHKMASPSFSSLLGSSS